MKQKLAFLGAGSFSDGVLPWVDTKLYEFVGYFDDKPIKQYRDYPVLGKLHDVFECLNAGVVDVLFVTIGDNEKRQEVFDMIAKNHYDKIINVISPQAAILNRNSIKGRGIFVGFSSYVGAEVVIYDNCIINTGAIIEHHTIVEKHCNIAPRATINGLCHIKEKTYVGSGSVIIQMITVEKETILGAGAVVVSSILESGTYVGVPAKKIK